jgi:hypothetical protein
MTELQTDARRSNRSAAIVVAVLLGALLLGAVVVIAVSWHYLASRPGARPTVASSAPGGAEPALPAASPAVRSAKPAPPRAKRPALAAGAEGEEHRWPLPPEIDRTKVEPLSLFEPARRLARSFDPRAELAPGFPFVVYFPVRRGAVDVTASDVMHFMHFNYAWSYLDASKPPGEDLVRGAVSVRYVEGALVARKTSSMGDEPSNEVLPDPTCPAARAWQAAVASGVPETAVAKLLYYDATPFGPGGPYVWSFRVDGHDELRREIDAQTCVLVKSWAQR